MHDKKLLATRAPSTMTAVANAVLTPPKSTVPTPTPVVSTPVALPAVASPAPTVGSETVTPRNENPPLSDVCCQDVDEILPPAAAIDGASKTMICRAPARKALSPVAPPHGGLTMNVAILTVSDRAASNSYATGDLSGPATEGALLAKIDEVNSYFVDSRIEAIIASRKIVPDEARDVAEALTLWSDGSDDENVNEGQACRCDLVLTTGGTGELRCF